VLRIEGDSFANPWTREMYLAELQHADVARIDVAVDPAAATDRDSELVGFCSYWHVVDEVHINNLAVTPALRHQGVATALLRHLMERARAVHARRILLEVRRSNTAAQQLYARLDFAIVGVRAAYYSAPVEDALVLALELA
jgi:ribosomal-protein-alanine N-acetyltransferase